MMLASTEDADIGLITLEDMQTLFDNIPGDAAKGMARRKGIDHGKMLYYGDGYATAWFMWWDEETIKAFAGGRALKLWRMRCIRIRKYK